MWMQESNVGDGITLLLPLPLSSPSLSPSLQLPPRSLQSLSRSLQSLSSSLQLPLLHTCTTLSVRSLRMGKHNFLLHLKVNLPLESLCILFPIFHHFELRICVILISVVLPTIAAVINAIAAVIIILTFAITITVDIGLVEKPFQHTCLYHLQDCVVNGEYLAI